MYRQAILLLISLLLLPDCQCFSPYQVKAFKPDFQLLYHYTLISKDLSKMIAMSYNTTNPTTRNFYFFSIDRGNFQQLNQFTRTDTSGTNYFIRADYNFDRILTYSPLEKRVSLYRPNGAVLDEIQPEFTPHQTLILSTVQMSADGSKLCFGTNTLLVSYQWNGTDYASYFNGSTSHSTSFRALSPDGLYLVYGQTNTLNLRVINTSDPTDQKNFINMVTQNNVTSPTAGIISWIGFGQPDSENYDIVCRYTIDTVESLVHIQFNSANNTLVKAGSQSFPPSDPVSSITWVHKFFITSNGKYVLVVYRALIRLFQKQFGRYAQVYNETKISHHGRAIYVAEDASLIVISPQTTHISSRLNFLFKCDVKNCLICSWINLCQTCNSGYVLEKDACACPLGTFNLSGICVNCSITNCLSCFVNDICQSCGNGYTLINNTCICPLPMNVSIITQKCVTCNVENCYQCSIDDICDVFQLIPNTIDGQKLLTNDETILKDLDKMESVVVVLSIVIGLILIGMILIGLALIKLMNKLPSQTSIKPEILHKSSFMQQNETSAILKQQYQEKSQGKLAELPPKFTGQPQEELAEHIQIHKQPQLVEYFEMNNYSQKKAKERRKKKSTILRMAILNLREVVSL